MLPIYQSQDYDRRPVRPVAEKSFVRLDDINTYQVRYDHFNLRVSPRGAVAANKSELTQSLRAQGMLSLLKKQDRQIITTTNTAN